MVPSDIFNIIKLVGELSIRIEELIRQAAEHRREMKEIRDHLKMHDPKPALVPVENPIPEVIPSDAQEVPAVVEPIRKRRKNKSKI